VVCVLAAGLPGCGGTGRSPAELRLEREDLIAVARALQIAQPSVEAELATARRAWPLLVNGLPSDPRAVARTSSPVAAAAASTAKIPTPPPLTKAQFVTLTGPGSPIAALFRDYLGLVKPGWAQIAAAIEQIEHGAPAAALFARENVDLYIESVYDGQFDLSQIDKHLERGYQELGGPAAFGSALPEAEVQELEETYSEPAARLQPHASVKLGT
jgi:hypothetical protein